MRPTTYVDGLKSLNSESRACSDSGSNEVEGMSWIGSQARVWCMYTLTRKLSPKSLPLLLTLVHRFVSVCDQSLRVSVSLRSHKTRWKRSVTSSGCS